MDEAQRLRLLLAVDGSSFSEAAIELVAGMSWPAGTAVQVLAVAPQIGLPNGLGRDQARVATEAAERIIRRNRVAARQVTGQVADRLRRADGLVEPEICEGEAAEVILERATARSADLIVIGARGLSTAGEFRLGSTAHKVAELASCSVLIARPPVCSSLHRIVLGVDGSNEARRAVEWVHTLAFSPGVEVTTLGIAEASADFPVGLPPERRDAPDAELQIIRQALLHSVEAHVRAAIDRLHGSAAHLGRAIRHGQAAAELVRYAQQREAGLIVIGARGQTRAATFRLGGVAEKLVRFAPCSILVAR